jgi:cytosine/adenosine deaminase-related metal-dependent hydrolase
MHLSEGGYEAEYCLRHFGQRPVAYYAGLDVLGPWTLASQCVQVDAAEIAILAERGCRVSHMPMSNCEVGAGVAPLPELLSAGVPVGLGTDGYLANYLENMRWAFLVHKATKGDPAVLPAAAVWHMATCGGAAALGLPEMGSLTPGDAADLVLLRLDLPTPVAAGNLRDQMLLWRNPGDIAGVMAAGRWLMRDGIVLGADEAAIQAHCREAANQLWGR